MKEGRLHQSFNTSPKHGELETSNTTLQCSPTARHHPLIPPAKCTLIDLYIELHSYNQ